MEDAATRKALAPESKQSEGDLVVPLHEEQITVRKEERETGRVRVTTVTREHEQLVDELLKREQVEVQRIPVGKAVAEVPPVREEGDTIIVPVVEEVLVVQRRLMLKEEVHIKRIHATERYQDRVRLRKQEAVVNRVASEAPATERSSISPDRSIETMKEGK